MAGGPGLFLFERRDGAARTGTYLLLDGSMKQISAFTLPAVGQGEGVQVLFALDGKSLVLNHGQEPPGTGSITGWVVDAATGKTRGLGDFPVMKNGRAVGLQLAEQATREEFLVFFLEQVGLPNGDFEEQTVVRRYSWQGAVQGEFHVPGRATSASPDGRLVAWQQSLDRLVQAVTLQEVASGQPDAGRPAVQAGRPAQTADKPRTSGQRPHLAALSSFA